MEAAIGAARGLIGTVLNQLSDEFIQAYVDSSELGLNAKKIKDDLLFTQGLLHEAQERGVSDNPGLKGLVQKLSAKADVAEDALDELHYFIIQDQLDGTNYAEPDLGDGLRSHARHGRYAARYTVGNWLNCFPCWPMQDDGAASTDVTSKSHNSNLHSSNDGPLEQLPFDRVAMSKKIKSVIEEIHSLCDPVSKLLTPLQSHTTSVDLIRPLVGSTSLENKLYGRSVIFEQTIEDITTGMYQGETLSVLPIVGPGGIGKTTFTQHLYNDKRIEEHFTVRVWVCVSIDFDVLRLTQQIHSCILATENEENTITNGTPNLDQLQISIIHRLKSKRFLIVLDDIWKCDSDYEWKILLVPFTKGESKGSMVLVTTRFPKIEERVKKGTRPINLKGLDPHEFFEFFQACVFGENEPNQQYSELVDIGKEIAQKLKCSPLAAKTVARLLKKDLSWEHWRKVLENNEWQNQTNKDDIMPALKISYDYLPFHLKQCFSYFSLFPEDRRFKVIHLQGLDPHEFFEFFQACVFGENKPNQEYSELVDIGKEIAQKLKCSPLAAKTVARLLQKDLSWEHWRKVLENNEWQNETEKDDIMPALRISYDYLPFHLKQCFPYFSLFPEDYRFKVVDINRFWTAIGIVDSSYQNKNYLEELVDNGFLMKEVDYSEGPYCVMHDLLHELSRSVSSQECNNISSLSFSANEISPSASIRHLSITIEDRYDENFRQEMAKLKSRIKITNLRTLMIFREYRESIVEILKDTFSELESIRVLFIAMKSTESLPKKISKLLHLRYLKISSPYRHVVSLPSTLPRFYHLMFLDLQDWRGSSDLPKCFSRLVNLRHFIADSELHSNVPEVGKIEHLEELKEFHVKKESVGFELEELGKLKELGGELSIYNLEKVATKGEASKANLALKRNLKSLRLVWYPEDSDLGTEALANLDDDVVDGLQPHVNLRELRMDCHGGARPPIWLRCDIPIGYLESLILWDVSWCTLPPFGKLPYLKRLNLKRIARVCLIEPDSGTGRNQSFMHLKEVEFSDMPLLERWTVEPNCHLFPVLERIECIDCPSLLSLPFFPECSVSCARDSHCPSLRMLQITGCPNLFVSPIPPAPALKYITVKDTHRYLESDGKLMLLIDYSGALAFHNMGNVRTLFCHDVSITSWTGLQKVTSPRELTISKVRFINCENLSVDVFNPLITAASLKDLQVINDVHHPGSTAVDLLSEVARKIKQLPAGSFQLKKLHVDSISAVLVAPVCRHLAATLRTLTIKYDQRVESLTEEEERALQLLTSLEGLQFAECPGLPSLPQGLHSLPSLVHVVVIDCPEIRSLPMGGLPASLQGINVEKCSAELHEHVRKLEGTNPELVVDA